MLPEAVECASWRSSSFVLIKITSKKNKEISEDMSKRFFEKIVKVTAKYIEEISNLEKNKNIEILQN